MATTVLKEGGLSSALAPLLYRIKLIDKIFFTEHLGVMLKAGISLAQAFGVLSEQATNPRFKMILQDVEKRVEAGNSLSKSLSRYPKVFPEIFVNMVGAGEISGKLEEVLKTLEVQMKKDHEIVAKVRGAMIYPAVIFTAMIGVGVAMMVFIIPNILSLFTEVEAELPLATRLIIGISNFLTSYGIFVAMGGVACLFLFVRAIRTPAGKDVWHRILLKVPVLGHMIKKVNLARISRTLSSLLKTDIPIIQTFRLTAAVVSNTQYRNTLEQAAEKLKKGSSIVETLKAYPSLYPPIMYQMIKVGEETGTMDTILETLADFYEQDVSETMNNLSSIIEPVLLLVMGVGVGLMAIAIIMPTYSLIDKI